MSEPRILVLAGEPDVYADLVRARFPEAELSVCREYSALESTLAGNRPEIVLASKIGAAPFPRDVLFGFPSVEWVQTTSAGVDHLLPLSSRVTLTSASGIHDEALSDYVVASVLLWNLHFPRFIRQQRERRWKSEELDSAKGQTLGVLGLGSIGTRAASKAKGLGMRILGVKARPEIRAEGVDEVFGAERLKDVARQCDFLAVTLPLTEKTRGLVSGDTLRSMKPGSVLINLSRGRIVDEEALVAALREGPLKGAVMDVFATEPLPEDSPLWTIENLVITPHTGDIRGWRRNVAELFCENLARRSKGEPLRNVVDPGRGY